MKFFKTKKKKKKCTKFVIFRPPSEHLRLFEMREYFFKFLDIEWKCIVVNNYNNVKKITTVYINDSVLYRKMRNATIFHIFPIFKEFLMSKLLKNRKLHLPWFSAYLFNKIANSWIKEHVTRFNLLENVMSIMMPCNFSWIRLEPNMYLVLIFQLKHSVSFDVKLPIQLSKVAQFILENYFMGFPNYKVTWIMYRRKVIPCANNGPNFDLIWG